MVSWLDSVILGVVEGFTEFLPISSTGHLILASRLLGISSSEFLKTFEIVIQLGAILAVAVLYARRLLVDRRLFLQVCAAFIPTAIVGLLVYPYAKAVLLGNVAVVLVALFVGGILLILFERARHSSIAGITDGGRELSDLTYFDAVKIGFAQCVAIIPGVSRAAATIVGGMFLGFSRQAIVEFSFLLAMPTMLAASVLDLYKTGWQFSAHEWQLLAVGFVTAFIVALASVYWLLRYIRTHTFTGFGWYRIGVAAVLFFALYVF